MNNVFKNQLPSGYAIASIHTIQPEEIMYLRKSVGWDSDSSERWGTVLNQSLVVIGVRDESGMLVGTGCLAGSIRHAVLCDLVVDPQHQKQGIGEAIMGILLDAIKSLEIKYVYAELAETNPFREKMIEAGFKNTGASLFLEVQNL